MIVLYALSVLFCMFMSWLMWSIEGSKYSPPRPFKEKLVYTVMPFIPIMNLAWVLYKIL